MQVKQCLGQTLSTFPAEYRNGRQYLTTDSIGLEREDSMVSVKVSIDWPTGSNQQLVSGIRQYICEELSSSINQESKPEVKVFDDGKTAVEATVKGSTTTWQACGRSRRRTVCLWT